MDAAHFLVSGRVQGVGFRAATRRRAQELGLSGFARNLADGRVEAFAQGDPLALDAFALWLQQGPSVARVDAVQRTPIAPEHATSGFSYG